jgi:GxxExxY protein
MGKMIHEQLSGAIIGIAMEVLNELNPGLDEVLYERAMVIELRRRGHEVAVQKSYPVFYRAELIGNLIPDLIVDSLVIVDPKVVSAFTETHVAQMIGYLNITGLELALLLSFKKTPTLIGSALCDDRSLRRAIVPDLQS